MSDQLYFSRDSKVYIEQGTNIWEIPVMDGFSFSQATNASEITLNEMSSSAGLSRRARQMFTDSYAPAEWSFSTYVRPFIGDGTFGVGKWGGAHQHAIEEVLWANFVALNSWTASDDPQEGLWDSGIVNTASNMVIDFSGSNVTELGEFNIYFSLGGCAATGTPTIYKLNKAVVNSVGIDFDIDGIAMLNWSGFGAIISESALEPVPTITEANFATSNFIRNRLTSLAVIPKDRVEVSPGVYRFKEEYNVVLTGGSVNFENNITYLTPELLCIVTQPIGAVTGTRSIGGNFTAYLNAAVGSTADLFEDIINATDVVTNQFGLTFKIGGVNAPRMEINMPQAHLELPSHSIEDVISLDVNFHALPTGVSETDEATITYVGTTY